MDKIRVTTITNVACFDISNNDDLPSSDHIELGVLPSASRRSVTDFGRLVVTFFSNQALDGHQPVSDEWCTSLINVIIDNIFLNNVFSG